MLEVLARDHVFDPVSWILYCPLCIGCFLVKVTGAL
jgi:hypothetical protein